MNANDVIEAYVTDVAVHLPRRQRNDVAFELRALLQEELQAKAGEAGRAADAAMATELLNAFGRPADVAARYRPALTIIDPADGPGFLRATVIGLAIIWLAGLVAGLGQPIASAGDLLQVVGRWWVGSVLPSLWWPGVLVVGFGLAAWGRRRWPKAAAWQPRADDRIHGGRGAMVMALIGIACGVFVLFDPRWLLDVLFGGNAAPVAYEALTYTDTFRHRQGPWLLALLALNIPMYATVIVLGRWPALLRRIETGLALITCAVMAWVVLDGPVMMTPASDAAAKFFLALITVFSLIALAMKFHRSIRPAPRMHAG